MQRKSIFAFVSALVLYIAVAAGITALVLFLSDSSLAAWAGVDARRFHDMAATIIQGLTPYVDYVDPKPPLLYAVVAGMDLLAPAGSIDALVIGGLNVISALLIRDMGKEEYGEIAGTSAGLFFLVTAVFVQGFFFFAEQFALVFVLFALHAALASRYAVAGCFIGLACGFKQYSILALLPLAYLMWAENNRQLHRLVLPAIGVVAAIFGIFALAYGSNATFSAMHWTFGIAPQYASGNLTGVPDYRAQTAIGIAINLLAGIAVTLPALVFAGVSIAARGLRNRFEVAIALALAVFLATLFVRQYLHYWILALPFLSLLACREFGEQREKRRKSDADL
jgi:general stress protein CsbA